MFKRTIYFILILSMVISITGCSRNSQERSGFHDELTFINSQGIRVSLGMDKEVIEDRLGQGWPFDILTGQMPEEDFLNAYLYNGVYVKYNNDDKAELISVFNHPSITDNTWVMMDGVTIGFTFEDLSRKYNIANQNIVDPFVYSLILKESPSGELEELYDWKDDLTSDSEDIQELVARFRELEWDYIICYNVTDLTQMGINAFGVWMVHAFARDAFVELLWDEFGHF